MDIDKINVGDKFSTENKLLLILGFPQASGNTRLSLLKEVQQYFDYTKTGKLARGKETNEIVILDKYIQPKLKQDGRVSEIVQYLKPLILMMENKSVGNKRLFLDEFKIADIDSWKKFKGNNRVEFYKYYLLNDFKGKIKTALNQLYKEYDWFYYSYDYLLINTNATEQELKYQIATKSQSEYIDTMKLNVKDRIIARHKLEYPNEKNKTWKNLSYRYMLTLYKMVNDECRDVFDMDKCVDVVTISKSNTEPYVFETTLDEIRLYYKLKMADWIKKNDYSNVEDVVNFHNEIFNDVN